jgi:hypothetical protein
MENSKCAVWNEINYKKVNMLIFENEKNAAMQFLRV